MSKLSSREKLFQAAETLFATRGFKEVSIRNIASSAGVNSALVGYYFGGKPGLFSEVYRAQAVPLSRERMKQLAAILLLFWMSRLKPGPTAESRTHRFYWHWRAQD